MVWLEDGWLRDAQWMKGKMHIDGWMDRRKEVGRWRDRWMLDQQTDGQTDEGMDVWVDTCR